MTFDEVESQFHTERVYRVRLGPAYGDDVAKCERKLCFVATDREFLVRLLYELSCRADCFAVKYSVDPCDGMYLGRCFLMTEAPVAELWRTYKSHAKVMCSVQDDTWANPRRTA